MLVIEGTIIGSDSVPGPQAPLYHGLSVASINAVIPNLDVLLLIKVWFCFLFL